MGDNMTPAERAEFYAARHLGMNAEDPRGPGTLELATVWAAVAQARAAERIAHQLTTMNARAERTETGDL